MPDPVLLILAGGGLALGVAAAQTGGPLSLNWRPRIGGIQQRLRCLPRREPATPGRLAGRALLVAVLAGGALAAYAAEPSVAVAIQWPAPAASVGVVSGARPAPITPAPVLKVASTAAAAAPSLFVPVSAPNSPSSVPVVTGVGPLSLDQLLQDGLTPEEARRSLAYQDVLAQEVRRLAPATASVSFRTFAPEQQRALLGAAAYADMVALRQKQYANQLAAILADLAARPVGGSTSYYVPAGAIRGRVAAEEGIDTRGYWVASPPDANRGVTVSLAAGTAEAYADSPAASRPAEGPIGVTITTALAGPPT